MHARILASSVLAALAFSTVAPAFAEEATPETLDSLMASLSDLSCEGKQGRAVGQCITDVLKRIKAIEHDFSVEYKAEVAAWRKEHDGDGISTEYTLALKAFNDGMQAKRKAFQERVVVVRKAFFDQITLQRVQKGEVNTKGSQTLTSSDEQELLKQCSEKFASDQDAERVCLRNIIQRKSAVEKRLKPIRARVQAEEKASEDRQKLPRR